MAQRAAGDTPHRRRATLGLAHGHTAPPHRWDRPHARGPNPEVASRRRGSDRECRIERPRAITSPRCASNSTVENGRSAKWNSNVDFRSTTTHR
ncbi:hypothetical protein A33M_0621 [Rhodovulum sp. PH10]|nr:hypothetical protein A33M_0621 [Rhodovulum sp. PH10]